MISTDAYVSVLFEIILTMSFQFFKSKKKRIVYLCISLILIISLTIIYTFKDEDSYILFLISEYIFLPIKTKIPTELNNNDTVLLILLTFGTQLFSYFNLIYKCKKEYLETKLNIKYLIITILISLVISSYLRIWILYFVIQKSFLTIYLTVYIYTILLVIISTAETEILINLYFRLSAKASKSK